MHISTRRPLTDSSTVIDLRLTLRSCFPINPQDNSGGLLPSYRTHPRMRAIDIPGMRRSLDTILGWHTERALTCHTDPIEGGEVKLLLKRAWGWVWD